MNTLLIATVLLILNVPNVFSQTADPFAELERETADGRGDPFAELDAGTPKRARSGVAGRADAAHAERARLDAYFSQKCGGGEFYYTKFGKSEFLFCGNMQEFMMKLEENKRNPAKKQRFDQELTDGIAQLKNYCPKGEGHLREVNGKVTATCKYTCTKNGKTVVCDGENYVSRKNSTGENDQSAQGSLYCFQENDSPTLMACLDGKVYEKQSGSVSSENVVDDNRNGTVPRSGGYDSPGRRSNIREQ